VDLVSALANALFLQDRPVEGADAVRAAEPRLLRLDDRPREIEHCTNLGVLLDAANQHAEAQATTRRGIALARAEGDRIGELVLLNNLAFSLHDIGRVAAALEPLVEAYRLKQLYPELRTSALFVHVQLGNMHRTLGGYTEALELLQTGMGVVDAYSPGFSAGAHNSLAHLYLDLGQTARSQQHLRQALEVEASPPVIRAITHLLRARSALDQGKPRMAGEALQDAQGCMIASTRYAVRGQAALLGSRLLPPDAAYPSAIAVAREAGRLQMEGLRMAALASAARHALACGLEAAAVAHALEALALWPEHAPDAVCIAEVWLAAVECLDAAGDPRADGVLQTAAAWITAAHRERVPEPFRESFLHRHAVNRALMARAAARAGAANS
jgi:tetratricopeptide (TPR) repeat protein